LRRCNKLARENDEKFVRFVSTAAAQRTGGFFLTVTRRDFLRTTVSGGALSWTVPAFLARTFAEFEVHAANDTQVATGQDSPILVILQMAGESADANSGASVGAVSGTMRPHGSVLDYVERTALDAQVSSDTMIARKVSEPGAG